MARFLCVCLATLSVSFSARAVTVNLDVFSDGNLEMTFTEVMLGCVDVVGTPTANCDSGGNTGQAGDLRLDSWSLFLDEDPIISANVAVTNTGATDQTFTMIFTLPIVPAIPGGTVIGGSVQGGGTANTVDGVTIETAPASAIFTALIDGSPVQTLYDDFQSFSTTDPFGSINIPSLAFGSPIPSQAGPAALNSIGIQLEFVLSAGDSASFTSVFVVQPVPVPAAVWFFGSALVGLQALRRRTAA